MTGGSLTAQLFTSVPSEFALFLLVALALLFLLIRSCRLAGLLLAAMAWCLFSYQQRLDSRLDPALAGEWLTVSGRVASVPRTSTESIQFQFLPDPSRGSTDSAPSLPGKILLNGYREWPDIRAGQRWRFEVRLKPPWGRVNFNGGDTERWLFAEGIGATGTLRGGEQLAGPDGFSSQVNVLRERIRNRIGELELEPNARGIVQALAVADRSAMDDSVRGLLMLTGTSHLLAISGLHIGLAAVGGGLLARGLLGLLVAGRPGRVAFALTLAGGMATASFYALLSGLGVSTLRACAMFCIVAMSLLAARTVHPARPLLLALSAVLIVDPFVPLRAGFWFSFLAVAALLYVFQPRPGRPGWGKTPLMAQGAVILLLLPVSSAWFGAFSLVGFAANLVAIPWVSLFLVPLVLGGIAFWPLAPGLTDLFWTGAGQAAALLLWFLEALSRVQPELLRLARLPLWQSVLALAGAALLWLPRGISWRWTGAILLLPLFLPVARTPGNAVIQAEILDVGQGTSVIVEAGGETLLYDSGPGDGEQHDLVDSVIVPALSGRGIAEPDVIVIGHGDMDHAGGLSTLLQRYPQASYHVNLPAGRQGLDSCRAGLSWDWPGARIEALHPSTGLPYLGNDSSCVISVRVEDTGLLLSGDISSQVENRLVAAGLKPHTALLVPHHGSGTSSSELFLDQVTPDIAIVTAGIGNRFGFPREHIRRRYQDSGVKFWETGGCGAIRMALLPGGKVHAVSARRQRLHLWRWPAAENCP